MNLLPSLVGFEVSTPWVIGVPFAFQATVTPLGEKLEIRHTSVALFSLSSSEEGGNTVRVGVDLGWPVRIKEGIGSGDNIKTSKSQWLLNLATLFTWHFFLFLTCPIEPSWVHTVFSLTFSKHTLKLHIPDSSFLPHFHYQQIWLCSIHPIVFNITGDLDHIWSPSPEQLFPLCSCGDQSSLVNKEKFHLAFQTVFWLRKSLFSLSTWGHWVSCYPISIHSAFPIYRGFHPEKIWGYSGHGAYCTFWSDHNTLHYVLEFSPPLRR